MKPAHTFVERRSGHGWRTTYSDASGPVLSVWHEKRDASWHEAQAAMRRMSERWAKMAAQEECE